MSLPDGLQKYRSAISLAKNLIDMAHKNDAEGQPLLTPDETQLVTEAALLKVFIAWEAFLENAIACYMLGELSIIGNLVPKFVAPRDAVHASNIAVGTQRFFDYADPDRVRKLCGLFFQNGEPFETVLSSVRQDLIDLRTIRNAAAHLSSSTSDSLNSVASRKLRRPSANTTVYSLILATDPTSPIGETIFDVYLRILDTVVERISQA